jgi:hypothetical protein
MIKFIILGIIGLISLLVIYASTRKNTCEYRYDTGKCCKNKVKWLHFPSLSRSCDEHKEYFSMYNDRVLKLDK